MQLGAINELRILRETSVGLFLGDDKENEVLLPGKFVPDEWDIDDLIEVFVFRDSENRPIATTEQPKILVNEFALLEVIHNTRVGSFVDWGLDKDLLVPYSQQDEPMIEGEKYIVYMFLDSISERLVGTTKFHKALEWAEDLNVGDKVKALCWEDTEIGMKVIVDHLYKGMIYKNEVFENLHIGDVKTAYIKNVRPDGKLDLSVKPIGYAQISGESEKIIGILRRNGGFLALNDKSAPEDIQEALQMSKKSFKKAIGALYKERMISIEPTGIKLVD